jgi:intracellular septation protein A
VGIFRTLLLIFLIAVAICGALYLITSDRKFLRWAGLMLKLVVAAGLLFFAVLILERIA